MGARWKGSVWAHRSLAGVQLHGVGVNVSDGVRGLRASQACCKQLKARESSTLSRVDTAWPCDSQRSPRAVWQPGRARAPLRSDILMPSDIRTMAEAVVPCSVSARRGNIGQVIYVL